VATRFSGETLASLNTLMGRPEGRPLRRESGRRPGGPSRVVRVGVHVVVRVGVHVVVRVGVHVVVRVIVRTSQSPSSSFVRRARPSGRAEHSFREIRLCDLRTSSCLRGSRADVATRFSGENALRASIRSWGGSPYRFIARNVSAEPRAVKVMLRPAARPLTWYTPPSWRNVIVDPDASRVSAI